MTLPSVTPSRESFKLPDVRRPELMPSLPAWIASRVGALQTVNQRNPNSGKWEDMWTLPVSLILTETERREVQQHVDELRSLSKITPSNDAQAEVKMLAVLTEFMATFSTATQSELIVEARGKALMDGVDNLPVWAVEAAIRRFHRNDWPRDKQGQRYAYRWCPPPADVREVAYSEMLRVEARARALDKIIQAVPPIEFSSEHCARMSARFGELLQELKTPPVGKDGSGGAAGQKPVDGAHCGTRPKAQPGLKREGGRRRSGDRRK